MTKKLLFSLCMIGLVLANIMHADNTHFIKSFLDSYEFSRQGRYTRGYPPLLAQLAKTSLEQLEREVRNAGFRLNGRIIIAGYQENAVPSYYPDVEIKTICDEVSSKTKSGWNFAPGNLFGYYTGFLFKNCNEVSSKALVEHIAPERVELFRDDASILQKDLFGNAFGLVDYYYHRVHDILDENKTKELLPLLVQYWQALYANELKTRHGDVVATQDILFSTKYAQYLAGSNVNLLKLFLGPDITYPIRVLPLQPLQATANAQQFVERLMGELKTHNNGKTGYIFCSFVDGVGKSTLLGNVINWLKYGKSFDKFEAVNNSSSQKATLYQVNDDVFIIDLPAQMSHFCIKPEGYVYVDPRSCDAKKANLCKRASFIAKQQKQTILNNFIKRLEDFIQNPPVLEQADTFSLYDRYIHNVITMNSSPKWVPFEYQGYQFVASIDDFSQIRILVSLDEAHSTGLKVNEPELMIFDGAVLPMRYEVFLHDLITRMQEAHVTDVVFVDFISMYPRSSRENIRTNFMLQQLRALYKDNFITDASLYRSMSDEQELYPLLAHHKNQIIESLALETAARYGMHELINKEAGNDIKKLSCSQLTNILRSLSFLEQTDKEKLYEQVNKKVEAEFQSIQHFAYGKLVESCWNVPLQSVVAFSEAMIQLCGRVIPHAALQSLWSGLNGSIKQVYTKYNAVLLEGGAQGIIVAKVAADCHNPLQLGRIYNMLRMRYMDTIFSLLHIGQQIEQVPLVLKHGPNNSLYLIQKITNTDLDQQALNSSADAQANHPNELHYLYGYDPIFGPFFPEGTFARQMYSFVKEQRVSHAGAEVATNLFVTTSDLCDFFDEQGLWELASYTEKGEQSEQPAPLQLMQLLVRMLATLDMIIKCCDADIMGRIHSQDDFVASLRLHEQITLSCCFGIPIQTSLFENYETVEPIISLPWQQHP